MNRATVAYKACFHCELLFEVDADAVGRPMPCPQCGEPLEDYVDENAPIEADEPAETQALADSGDGIVSTHAFDGLAASVREQLAARKARRDATEEPAPARPEPVRAVPVPVDPEPRLAAKAHGTKILDLSTTDDPLSALAEHESMEPTAMLGRDMAAAVNAAARPPEPEPVAEPEPPRPKRKYGSPPEARERRTLMVDSAELGELDPAGPPPDAGRTIPPARRPAPSGGGAGRVVLLILALAIVGAGGGAAIWWFGLRKPAPEAKPDAGVAAQEPSWDEKLAKQLEDGQATLPTVAADTPLAEGPFVAGGLEALGTSAGVVPGLPSAKINEPLVESDGGGEWVRTLKPALDPLAGDGQAPLLLALDAKVPVRTLVRMAYSGFKAGFRKFGLVVGKEGTPGAKAMLPFTLALPETTLPKEGALVVHIGSLGLTVVVQGPGGAQISAERTTIPRRDDNSLDLEALGKRLDALHAAHPDVKAAVIHPNEDQTLDNLAQVISHVRKGAGKDRFPDIAVSTR